MIDVTLRAGMLEKRREDAVVIPLLAGRKLTAVCNHLPEETAEFLKNFLRNFDSKGGFGDIHTLYQVPGLHCYRLVLVGTGEEKSLTLDGLRRLSAKVSRKLEKSGARSAACYLADAEARATSLVDRIQAVSEGITLGLYTFDHYKTKKNEQHRPLQRAFVMILDRTRETLAMCQQALARGVSIAEGVNFARDLANHPGNVCTPAYIAAQALSLQDDHISVEVMDKAAIEAAGFRALLAVNQGSAKEPRFIVLRYNGAEDDSAPIALVGKGLTFDAGGISIKPGPKMDEMKYDMCGSATVLGVFKAASALGLKANLLGVIPSTENLLGAAAFKPGDIITAYNGTTIEVLNTDAEGRLILADALAWAAEQNPAEIIDFATLTGACVVALGSQASGLMGNHKPLLKALSAAGDRTHDRVWELPMYEEYQKQIDSHIADIRNIGGPGAGTITAACFLSRFIGEHHWAHVDIAGTAWNMQGDALAAKGATGAAVRLTLDYLMHRFAMDDRSEVDHEDADS
ncbi:MAG: leucyl aminopeptidase [Mariprofundaceae bacterium]|nr:leucyl aminopeptidase [Mariprofundaceae bacterium]